MFSPDDFKLSVSSVTVPDQAMPDLVETVRASGFSGVELFVPAPGGDAHAHGVEPDLAPGGIAEVKHTLADAGLEVSCIATGLVVPPSIGGAQGGGEELVAELKRYVTLAESLGAKCLRVLGGELSAQEGEIAGAVDAVSDALLEAIAFAEQTSVSVLLETCGDFATTRYVREVVKQVYSDHFGVLWNIVEPVRMLETVEETYDNLAGQVKHVHVQDFRYVDGRTKVESVPLGEGVVPVASCVKYLAHDGYEGFLSVETSLTPPDNVLPQHAQALHQFITEAFPEPVETE
ncbi:MAG: sugar phosphate isomerase/epimerase family protein [Planctomycetota bacterium]|jgi:sugar phosphate isomerase/epimerase